MASGIGNIVNAETVKRQVLVTPAPLAAASLGGGTCVRVYGQVGGGGGGGGRKS